MHSTFTRFEAHPAAGMMPSTDIPREAFTTSDTTELDHTYFANEDETVVSGVWECAPSKRVFESYRVHEMITVLSGSVTLTDLNDGRSETYTAGDTLFIAKGSRFIWEITETLRKFYFIVA